MLLVRRVLHKKLFISRVYKTKKGIKYTYPLIALRDAFKLDKPEFILNPEDMLLDMDFLRDEYTLCNCPITDSPHYELMRTLSQGGDIAKTSYIRRFRTGTLDWRNPMIVSSKDIHHFEQTYSKRCQEIQSDTYLPIQVYNYNGRYYILDGKHRAALCALMGRQVRCIEVSHDFLYDSFNAWMFEKMKTEPNSFKKNIEFIEGVYKLQKENE